MAIVHQDPPARPFTETRVVSHYHQRDPLLPVEPLQQGNHLLPGAGVEIAGGLVGQDQPRRHRHGPGDGHPLTLTAGEFGRAVSGPVLQPQLPQQLLAAAMALGGGDPAQHQRQLDVFTGGEAGDEVKRLEHETDAMAAQLGQCGF